MMNLPQKLSEHHYAPADFEGSPLDAAFLTSDDIPALVQQIEDLKEEVEALRQAHGPIRGGPPPEWDSWILVLPDEVFLDCLGVRNCDDPHEPKPRPRTRKPHLPIKAKVPRVIGRPKPATLIPRWQ